MPKLGNKISKIMPRPYAIELQAPERLFYLQPKMRLPPGPGRIGGDYPRLVDLYPAWVLRLGR